MYEGNYLAEQTYLAAEREAEEKELMQDPEYLADEVPQQPKAKGASA